MVLFGKNFTSKLKTITKHAVSRIAILKNQHQARGFYARSDVVELLNLGYHERALLRVDQLIKEQNMLDVFVMIENYCNFLKEKADLLDKSKECPDELKEATSSLIFASSRCGEFPELQKMREIFTSKFGKEFAAHAVELHKNNGVNSKMIQKLWTRRPAMANRMKVLKDIATEIGVTLHLEQDSKLINVKTLNVDQKQEKLESSISSSANDPKLRENNKDFPENIVQDEDLSDWNGQGKKYKDMPAAAQEAFESAAYGVDVNEQSNHTALLDKAHPVKNSSSESDQEVIPQIRHGFDLREFRERETRTQFTVAESHLSQNPIDDINIRDTKLVSSKHVKEGTKRQSYMSVDLGSTKSFLKNKYETNRQSDAAAEDEHSSKERPQLSHQSSRWNLQKSQADHVYPIEGRPEMGNTDGKYFLKQIHKQQEHMNWKLMSVRTR